MILRRALIAGFGFAVSVAPAFAGQPKLDKETCAQLHTEQATFVQSGILADLQRGPQWGKANLPADRLREIEHYIMLDEQIKFACREATLTPDLLRIQEIAKRLELNPNADPFAPPPDPEAKPDAASENSAAAPSGLAPVPDGTQKPAKIKTAPANADANTSNSKPAERPAEAAPVKPAQKSKDVKSKPASASNDALKVPPTHVAPPPAAKPAVTVVP